MNRASEDVRILVQRKRRTHRTVFIGWLTIFFITAITLAVQEVPWAPTVLFTQMFVGYVAITVFSCRYWVCPVCGTYFGRSDGKRCESCHTDFE